MYENKNYKIYLDPLKESKSFVEIIFNYFFKLEKKNKIKKNKILCINKKILELKKNIEYINYDLSNSLQEQKSNLMLVINLIDKFNDNKRTLLKFKNNIVNMIEENGILVIGENTKFERATFLKYKDSNFTHLHSINGGTISTDFINLL